VYVFTPALSVLFFQENISAKYCVGIFCIIAGVCITSISVLPVSSGNGKPGKDRC
jgi:drug/metabolite transporter (DMT)-like permease